MADGTSVGMDKVVRRVIFAIAIGWGLVDGFRGPAKPQATIERPGLSPEAIDIVEQRTRIVFRWHGDVSESLSKELTKAFDKYAGDSRGFLLSLNSRGGSVKTGFEIIDRIKREQKKRPVETMVESNSYCGSMCVGIYLAGTNRTAHRDAQFMFHEARLDASAYAVEQLKKADKTGKAGQATLASKSERDTAIQLVNVLLLAWYVEAGASRGWVDKLRGNIQGGRDVTLTGRDLVDQHAGIVDRLT